MYSRILTPLDGSEHSERVLPFARALAAGLSLPVTLLHAIEPEHPSISQSLNPILHQHQTAAHRTQHSRAYLEPVAAGMRNAGLSVDITIPQDDPATAIVDEAANDPGTLITMSSHGRSGLSRWWMGSVADKTLHLTENPLLIIHAVAQQQTAPEETFECITVPVDGSELAEEILPHVAYLSAAMGLTVNLVQAVPSQEEYYRYLSIGPTEVSRATPSYEEYARIVDGEAESYLAELRERLAQQGAAPVETQLLHGPPADCITDLASATANNLVAMTTHGRSGVGRLVLGSVAERVVRQSGDPVLLIRGAAGRPSP